jgi:hypothetical protein
MGALFLIDEMQNLDAGSLSAICMAVQGAPSVQFGPTEQARGRAGGRAGRRAIVVLL